MFLILSYFVRYSKLIKIGRGRRFFLSAERATFILSVSLARADRYVLHFSLALPFLPRTTRVDVPVFLLLLAPSFCSSYLLPTDYAPVVDVHRHRLPRFASSHLPPFSVSLLQRSGSKYILSLLQQSSISVSRITQKSACFSSLPSFSMRLSSIRLALSLSHSCFLFSHSVQTVLRLLPFFQNPSSFRLYGDPKLPF